MPLLHVCVCLPKARSKYVFTHAQLGLYVLVPRLPYNA
jgi:hypothetical protein